MSAPDPAVPGGSREQQLLAFFAAETAGFYAHLAQALTHFGEGGKLPELKYKPGAKATTKEGKPAKQKRAKRGPSAFNMFMQRKMQELKEQGFTAPEDGPRNALFTAAAGEWQKLSAEQKARFSEDYKHELAGAGSGEAAQPPQSAQAAPASAAEPTDGEDKKLKKKKKRKLLEEGGSPAEDMLQQSQVGLTAEKKKKKKKKHSLEEAA